jgi:hypothetical protein
MAAIPLFMPADRRAENLNDILEQTLALVLIDAKLWQVTTRFARHRNESSLTD